jgi:hypothetical protein
MTAVLPSGWNVHGPIGLFITFFSVYIAYIALRIDFKKLLCVLGVYYISIAIFFNPIGTAPNVLELASIKDNGLSRQRSLYSKDARTLVLGSQVPAMVLFSSGAAVLNGVHYYPPAEPMEGAGSR